MAIRILLIKKNLDVIGPHVQEISFACRKYYANTQGGIIVILAISVIYRKEHKIPILGFMDYTVRNIQ